MGCSRAGSLSLLRAREPQTFSGSARAGSTCWPSTACLAIVVGHSFLRTALSQLKPQPYSAHSQFP
jgi:hypothetical protein